MVTCGALLGASKAEEYLANPFFLTKLTLLAGVALHGLYFGGKVHRREERLISFDGPSGRNPFADPVDRCGVDGPMDRATIPHHRWNNSSGSPHHDPDLSALC